MWGKVNLYLDKEFRQSFTNSDTFDDYIEKERRAREKLGWKIIYYGRTIGSDKSYGNLICLEPSKKRTITYYWDYLKN